MEKLLETLNTFKKLPDWLFNPTILKWGEALLGLFIILFVFGVLRNTLAKQIKTAETRYLARKLMTFISYFVVTVYIVGLFSDSLGKLTLILGGVGAGIAFALQEVIASFAGFIAVSFGQFYKPGDRVLLGGIMGDVIDVSLLRTTLMECGGWVKGDLYNGRIVRITNSFVFKEPVYNYSGDFPFVWDEIVIPVKYGSNRSLTKSLLLQAGNDIVSEDVASAQQQWAIMVHKFLIQPAKIEPTVTLIANDNWLEYTLRYIVDYKQRRTQKDRLFNRILDDIDNSGGEIGIASTTIYIAETPVMEIRVQDKDDRE